MGMTEKELIEGIFKEIEKNGLDCCYQPELPDGTHPDGLWFCIRQECWQTLKDKYLKKQENRDK